MVSWARGAWQAGAISRDREEKLECGLCRGHQWVRDKFGGKIQIPCKLGDVAKAQGVQVIAPQPDTHSLSK